MRYAIELQIDNVVALLEDDYADYWITKDINKAFRVCSRIKKLPYDSYRVVEFLGKNYENSSNF